jgi:hypothetical protein
MRWLLIMTVCTAYDPICDQQQAGVYRSETMCVANGLATDPDLQFRCVREFPDGVPLPRPRPLR